MLKLLPIIFLFLLSACVRDGTGLSGDGAGSLQAFVPVYAKPDMPTTLASEDATTPTKKAGKIYAYRNYVFQNELNEGIHIIDNADPAQPLKVAIFNSGSTQLLLYACQRSGRTRDLQSGMGNSFASGLSGDVAAELIRKNKN